MKRLGRTLCLFGVGLAAVCGCGGRTGALDDIYADDGTGALGGSATGGSRAGSAGRGGSSNVAGSRPVGGSAPVAGGGGTSFGGMFPSAGAPTMGGFAGFGGVGPIAGAGGAGGFPVGGAGGSPPLDCQTCLTQTCTPQLAQCFQDVGCVAIFACVVGSGCNPLQCYSPQFCKDIIDQFGGPTGGSLSQVLEVVSCAVDSGCQCQ